MPLVDIKNGSDLLDAGPPGESPSSDAVSRRRRMVRGSTGDFSTGASVKAQSQVYGNSRILQLNESWPICQVVKKRQRLLEDARCPARFLPRFMNFLQLEHAKSKKIARGFGVLLTIHEFNAEFQIGRGPCHISNDWAVVHRNNLRVDLLPTGLFDYETPGRSIRECLTFACDTAPTRGAAPRHLHAGFRNPALYVWPFLGNRCNAHTKFRPALNHGDFLSSGALGLGGLTW